jgi:hypothetical protein
LGKGEKNSMKKRFKTLLILLSILMITSATYSAEKGTLKVMVIDDEGNVLPGVSLTLSSSVMMGSKSLISGADGEVLFVNLTPGTYELKSSIPGFQEKST